MKKLSAIEIFETVEYDAVVTKLEENLFLAERVIKRDGITLLMKDEVNEEDAAIIMEMPVQAAIAPFIIVRAYGKLDQYMDEQDKAYTAIFSSMFTEEEIETLTEFYTTHDEDYEKAIAFLDEEILPNYEKVEDN